MCQQMKNIATHCIYLAFQENGLDKRLGVYNKYIQLKINCDAFQLRSGYNPLPGDPLHNYLNFIFFYYLRRYWRDECLGTTVLLALKSKGVCKNYTGYIFLRPDGTYGFFISLFGGPYVLWPDNRVFFHKVLEIRPLQTDLFSRPCYIPVVLH